MNKTYLCVLPLALLLAASSDFSVAQEGDRIIDNRKTPPCLGDPRVPTVNLKKKKLETKPSCVRANPGAALVFRLTPKNDFELGTVEISPKDDANDWLAGDNSTYEDLIIIRIPDDLAPGDYDYGIKAPGQRVDPRVHVED